MTHGTRDISKRFRRRNTMGYKAIAGANSLVTKAVRPMTVVGANPAKIIFFFEYLGDFFNFFRIGEICGNMPSRFMDFCCKRHLPVFWGSYITIV